MRHAGAHAGQGVVSRGFGVGQSVQAATYLLHDAFSDEALQAAGIDIEAGQFAGPEKGPDPGLLQPVGDLRRLGQVTHKMSAVNATMPTFNTGSSGSSTNAYTCAQLYAFVELLHQLNL